MALNKLNLLPFGAQYYRAPTPRPDQWAADMENMAKHGFNTVKLWAAWRSNNPREGVYDFSDLDQLMDLAQKNGLKVIINQIFDTAPAWFLKQYPESLMVTNDGKPLYPMATACRQMAAPLAPASIIKPGVAARKEFIRQCVLRYQNHPALMCWDMWNEPEHTCAIKRETLVENLTCYCPESIREFKGWLKKKYGVIQELNRIWGRNYESFEEVEVPRLAQTFKDMVDWRLFMTDTITEECRMRIAAVKELDRVHPAMVHTVTIPFFPQATCGSDDYALAEQCDIFGNSVGSEPLSAAITLSAAPDKMVINSEIHAVGGSTYARPKLNNLEDMKRHLFLPLSLGIKGFVFWQYRPERLGLESPAWGLTDLEGNMTPWLEAAIRINNALQANSNVILNAARPNAKVAVLNSQRAQLFDFCVDQKSMMYIKSVKGAHAMLRAGGYAVDIVGDRQISEGYLKQYQVIYDPFPYYKDARTCRILKDWVAAGGTLIAESCFGGYSDDDGLHTMAQPGFGFAQVFQAKEAQVTTASSFQNAYDKEWATENADSNLLDIDFSGQIYKGYYFYQSMAPQGAQVLAAFRDGSPAAVCGRYGQGQAIWIGSLLAYAYEAAGCKENARLCAQLISSHSSVRPEIDTLEADTLCSALTAPEGQLLVADNLSKGDTVTIQAHGTRLAGQKLVNILTGQEISVQEVQGVQTAVLPVKPGTIEVYAVR